MSLTQRVHLGKIIDYAVTYFSGNKGDATDVGQRNFYIAREAFLESANTGLFHLLPTPQPMLTRSHEAQANLDPAANGTVEPWSLLVNMIGSHPASIRLAARHGAASTTTSADLRKQIGTSAQTQWDQALSTADSDVRIWVGDIRVNGLVVQPSNGALGGAVCRILLNKFILAATSGQNVENVNRLVSELRAVENI